MVLGLNLLQRLRLRLYKYEERRGGFSCASCKWFVETGYCGNPRITSPVTRDGCCTLWSGLSRFKA